MMNLDSNPKWHMGTRHDEQDSGVCFFLSRCPGSLMSTLELICSCCTCPSSGGTMASRTIYVHLMPFGKNPEESSVWFFPDVGSACWYWNDDSVDLVNCHHCGQWAFCWLECTYYMVAGSLCWVTTKVGSYDCPVATRRSPWFCTGWRHALHGIIQYLLHRVRLIPEVLITLNPEYFVVKNLVWWSLVGFCTVGWSLVGFRRHDVFMKVKVAQSVFYFCTTGGLYESNLIIHCIRNILDLCLVLSSPNMGYRVKQPTPRCSCSVSARKWAYQ